MSGKSIHDAVKSVTQYTTLNNAYKKKFTPIERWFLETQLLSDKTKGRIESRFFGTNNIDNYNKFKKYNKKFETSDKGYEDKSIWLSGGKKTKRKKTKRKKTHLRRTKKNKNK